MTTVVSVGERLIDPQRRDETRYRHVVKHLYAVRQRWHLAIPELPHNPRLRAHRAGCLGEDLSADPAWALVCEACRTHVLADDLAWYRPASLDAVRTALLAGNHAVVDTAQGAREMLVGDNAVVVILGRSRPSGVQDLMTAYRDPPSGGSPSQEQFHARAVRKLRDKASLGSGGPP
jgi:hypothetical protein